MNYRIGDIVWVGENNLLINKIDYKNEIMTGIKNICKDPKVRLLTYKPLPKIIRIAETEEIMNDHKINYVLTSAGYSLGHMYILMHLANYEKYHLQILNKLSPELIGDELRFAEIRRNILNIIKNVNSL